MTLTSPQGREPRELPAVGKTIRQEARSHRAATEIPSALTPVAGKPVSGWRGGSDEAVPVSGNGYEGPVFVLGSGVLGHTSFERHTDRYGAVHLTIPDSIPGEPAPARTVPVPGNDLAARIMQALAEARQDAAGAAAARQAIARTAASRIVAFDHAPLGAVGTLVAYVIHSNARHSVPLPVSFPASRPGPPPEVMVTAAQFPRPSRAGAGRPWRVR